uniref:Uncharacterized protein n=1 Tax=Onchocerca volvulus TaxID=6282 RepID=A0A8R1XRE0_ONCVO
MCFEIIRGTALSLIKGHSLTSAFNEAQAVARIDERSKRNLWFPLITHNCIITLFAVMINHHHLPEILNGSSVIVPRYEKQSANIFFDLKLRRFKFQEAFQIELKSLSGRRYYCITTDMQTTEVQ